MIHGYKPNILVLQPTNSEHIDVNIKTTNSEHIDVNIKTMNNDIFMILYIYYHISDIVYDILMIYFTPRIV